MTKMTLAKALNAGLRRAMEDDDKVVLMGEPEEWILEQARERDVDLIALPTAGRGGIARLILGSVAEHVVQKADRAVLLFHRVEG